LNLVDLLLFIGNKLGDQNEPKFINDDDDDDDGEEGQDLLSMNKRSFEDFRSLSTIGEGAYGKVYQVQDKITNKIYAMKVLKKTHLLQKKAIDCTITEKDILKKIQHPLIIKLYCTFQTMERVGFVMEYINGGQLFYHMRRLSNFNEDVTRFYAAELVLALEHLHSHHIIHRDLKPENILITSEGHLCLTDFGLAKTEVTHDEGASTFCGTIEYMPPKMIQGDKYGKPADFWSVGILIYDMLFGQPPFRNNNRKKLQEMILHKKICMPSYWKKDTHSIIRDLTMRDPKKRPKIDQIKKHPFFKTINWDKLLQFEIEPPFKPRVENGVTDTSNIDPFYTSKDPTLSPARAIPQSQDDKFLNFTYVRSMTPTSPTNPLLHIKASEKNGALVSH